MKKIPISLISGFVIFVLPSLTSAHEFHRPPRVTITIGAAYPPWPPFAYLEPTPYGQAIHWQWDYYAVLPPKPHSIHRRYLSHMQQQFGNPSDPIVLPSQCLSGIGPQVFGTAAPQFEIPSYASVLEAIETEQQGLKNKPVQDEPTQKVETQNIETLPAPMPNPTPIPNSLGIAP